MAGVLLVHFKDLTVRYFDKILNVICVPLETTALFGLISMYLDV